jgi:hypothetical protein
MAATKRERIVYTTVSTVLIIIVSSVYRYRPNTSEDRIQRNWNKPERMNIDVTNLNDGGSGQWIELSCKAYYDKNMSAPLWSSNATLFPSMQQGIITLPKITELDIVDVLCKYWGWNGCQAEEVKLFENPGNDVYYCSESVSKCSIVFQPDGSVNKMYEERETNFLGYIPSPGNQEKCSWIDCFVDSGTRVIGKKACCGPKCMLW